MSSNVSILSLSEKSLRLFGAGGAPTLVERVASFVPKSTTLLFGALLLFSPAAKASESAGAEQGAVGVVTQGEVVAAKPATETVRGIVAGVDERNDTITLRLSLEIIQQFRVEDGLLFNAVRFGDLVEVTVQEIAGAKTIVGLKEE